MDVDRARDPSTRWAERAKNTTPWVTRSSRRRARADARADAASLRDSSVVRWTRAREQKEQTTTRVMSLQKVNDFLKKTHHDALVKVSKGLSIVVFLLNIFFPGVGTLVACLLAGKVAEGVVCFLMMWLMCFVFFVGWLWSIVHGFLILQKSWTS